MVTELQLQLLFNIYISLHKLAHSHIVNIKSAMSLLHIIVIEHCFVCFHSNRMGSSLQQQWYI